LISCRVPLNGSQKYSAVSAVTTQACGTTSTSATSDDEETAAAGLLAMVPRAT
jgi:hypothetical protein